MWLDGQLQPVERPIPTRQARSEFTESNVGELGLSCSDRDSFPETGDELLELVLRVIPDDHATFREVFFELHGEILGQGVHAHGRLPPGFAARYASTAAPRSGFIALSSS